MGKIGDFTNNTFPIHFKKKMQIVIFHHIIDIHVDDVDDHRNNNLGA